MHCLSFSPTKISKRDRACGRLCTSLPGNALVTNVTLHSNRVIAYFNEMYVKLGGIQLIEYWADNLSFVEPLVR